MPFAEPITAASFALCLNRNQPAPLVPRFDLALPARGGGGGDESPLGSFHLRVCEAEPEPGAGRQAAGRGLRPGSGAQRAAGPGGGFPGWGGGSGGSFHGWELPQDPSEAHADLQTWQRFRPVATCCPGVAVPSVPAADSPQPQASVDGLTHRPVRTRSASGLREWGTLHRLRREPAPCAETGAGTGLRPPAPSPRPPLSTPGQPAPRPSGGGHQFPFGKMERSGDDGGDGLVAV